MEYTSVKGMFDILPEELHKEDQWKESGCWQYLESVLRDTAHDYGFKEIRTPILEKTELFSRGVGEGSDIVSKEMYTFLDRGNRSITLRPEGTAAVARSFVQHRLYTQPAPHKYYYIGSMFRYERPQAGRYREHRQFGVEVLGISQPELDAEVINLACEIYRRLSLRELNIQINSVGDLKSRSDYQEALSQYLRPYFSELSLDSQNRLAKNTLRILDSKDLKDQEILQNAPLLSQFLTQESKNHFATLLQRLDQLKLHYTINPKLVRGLDYYSNTVFEITSTDLGSQSSLGGGGRYDGLIAMLGGPNIPGIGFATGLERVLQTMHKQKVPFPPSPHPLIFLVPMGKQAIDYAFVLASELRREKISCDLDLSGKKIQHGLQIANLLKAAYCLIIGEEELSSNQAKLKVMATREVIDISLNALPSVLKKLLTRSTV